MLLDVSWGLQLMTYHIHKAVLSVEMLTLFQKELAFRKEHPELWARVTRRLQGNLSFDYNANGDYLDAFALDSKSIKNFRRGNIQVLHLMCVCLIVCLMYVYTFPYILLVSRQVVLTTSWLSAGS